MATLESAMSDLRVQDDHLGELGMSKSVPSYGLHRVTDGDFGNRCSCERSPSDCLN